MNDWLKLGIKGLDHLKKKESFSATWYLCQAKKITIGWGHVKRAGDDFNIISMTQGEMLLAKDCKAAIDCIKKLTTYELNQSQFDALVCLVFNIGVGSFASSTLLKRLNKGLLAEAAEQFLVWNKVTIDGKKVVSNGLKIRRAEERIMFLGK